MAEPWGRALQFGPEGDLSMFFHVYAMCAVEQGVSI